MFYPAKLHTMQPSATAVDSLTAFLFLKSTDIAGLKAELPTYLAKAADVDPAFSALEWWRQNASELPC